MRLYTIYTPLRNPNLLLYMWWKSIYPSVFFLRVFIRSRVKLFFNSLLCFSASPVLYGHHTTIFFRRVGAILKLILLLHNMLSDSTTRVISTSICYAIFAVYYCRGFRRIAGRTSATLWNNNYLLMAKAYIILLMKKIYLFEKRTRRRRVSTLYIGTLPNTNRWNTPFPCDDDSVVINR